MTTYVDVGTRFDVLNCDVCGIHFGLPTHIHQKCREEGRLWWCPGCGHKWHYGKTETQKLEAMLEAERRMKESAREQRNLIERRLNAQRGVTTKLKNRIANGLCPCCNRSFTNLHQHMKKQHPTYAEKDE